MVLAIPLQRSNALTLGNTLWGLVMDARSAALGSRNQVMHGVSHVGCILDPCMVYSLLSLLCRVSFGPGMVRSNGSDLLVGILSADTIRLVLCAFVVVY